MNCQFSSPLSDDDLSLLLDGEADDDLRQHIEQCPGCRQRLESARRIEGYVKAALSRSDCPTTQAVADYHSGMLGATEAAAVEAHLKVCASCQADLKMLVDFLADEPAQKPAEVPSEPANIIRPPRGYFQATLQELPLRKVRGSSKRQHRAVADGIELLFDIQQSTRGISLEGLLIPQERDDLARWTGSLVEIRSGGELLTVCYIDEMGTFRCEPVPEGIVQIRITSSSGQSIMVSDMEIKV